MRKISPREFEYVATKLGISVDELQSYMDAPNKSYTMQILFPETGLLARRQGHEVLRSGAGRQAMIGLVAYGLGNLDAIANIYKRLNMAAQPVTTASELAAVDRITSSGRRRLRPVQ